MAATRTAHAATAAQQSHFGAVAPSSLLRIAAR